MIWEGNEGVWCSFDLMNQHSTSDGLTVNILQETFQKLKEKKRRELESKEIHIT